MHTLKKILFLLLVGIIFIINNNPMPTLAQQIGTTTLITYGARQLSQDGGNESRMTPDGRYIVFLSGYYEGPEKTQVFLYDRVANTTELVSVNANGDVANWNTYDVAISNDGQIIAYSTYAYNLGSIDTNERRDIYVLNRQTGQTTRVSVDSAGNPANNQSTTVFISGDGRFVTFSSDATNLIGTDTNGLTDVYVHDRQTAQTTRVSVDSAGVQADAASEVKGISNDGRYVLFESAATNLVANDTNNVSDVFVHDRQTAQTIRVSVGAGGIQGNVESYNPSISGDGQRVVFLSEANNLIANDANFTEDIFLRNLQTNTTSLVNMSSGGGQATAPIGATFTPTLSNNGRYVIFSWYSSALVAGDTNSDYDIFVRDLQTNTNQLISRTSAGAQQPYSDYTWYPSASISDNGQIAIFEATRNGFVPTDTNDKNDVFVRDTQASTTTSVTVDNTSLVVDGALGDSTNPVISGNGRYVAFGSTSSSLNPNGSTACFLYIYDHQTGTTTLASINDAGQPHYVHPTTCWGMFLSDDGRYLTFITSEPFVTGDNANSQDIFIRDLQLGTTTRVGLMPLGTAFPIVSGRLQMSGDARHIVFGSTNTTLVANDTNSKSDVFVYDIQTAQITRVSLDLAGNPFNFHAYMSDISSDGRYVLFATNEDADSAEDYLYIHDRQTNQTTRASVNSNGDAREGNSGRLSDDGRFVIFASSDSTITANDTNSTNDVFLLDRQTGLVTRVSVDSFGTQANNSSFTRDISGDGNLIFFASNASNLVPNDTNNKNDVFIYHRLTGQTTRLTVGVNGTPYEGSSVGGMSFVHSISNDGYTITFATNSSVFDTRDINFLSDVYIRELIPNATLEIPTLIAPADMGLVNPPVEFSWGAVNGATNYRLQIATDNQFITIKLDKQLTTTTYALNGLTSGTYYWRVIAYNDTLTSLWSAPRQFIQETDSPLLAPPTLIAPANMATFEYAPENMTYTWDAIAGVTSYQIQVSPDTTFATNIRINQTINGTSYIDPNYAVSAPATYYWRVRTIIEGMFYGEWAVGQFVVSNYPPLRLTAPANNYVTDVIRVYFTWESVPRYWMTDEQFQVARDPDFTDIVTDMNPSTSPFSLYYPAGVYYWRVRPIFNLGVTGIWSEVRQFTILPLPAPTIIGPSDNSIVYGTRATLEWMAVPNGYSTRNSYYQVQIATDNQLNNIVMDTTIQEYPRYTFVINMEAYNTTYYWRVRATHYSVGTPGDWSEIRQFTMQPHLPPTLITPANGETVTMPLISFTWDSPPSGSANQLQIARDDQFTQLVWNIIVFNVESYIINPLGGGAGTYYWRTRLQEGEWSETRQVIIEPPTHFILPTEGALFLNPAITFTWEATQATGWNYYLTCYRNANLTGIVFRQITTQTSFTYTFPTTPKTYYCTLYLNNNSSSSLTSQTRTFSIVSTTYDEAQTLDEQQLFNMAQPHLTGDMTFALFDITPTGILTTVQFDDDAVVTGNVLFTVQNGLIVITVADVVGGSVDQQSAFYQDVSALFMSVFTEVLPDDFISVKTFSMTATGLNMVVVRPTAIP